MKIRWNKFFERKTLFPLVGCVVGLVVVFAPQSEAQAVEVGRQVGGLLLILGSVLGFTGSEAKLDAEREKTRRETRGKGS